MRPYRRDRVILFELGDGCKFLSINWESICVWPTLYAKKQVFVLDLKREVKYSFLS